MAGRKNWDQIKSERLSTPSARVGHERARRAFELAEEIRPFARLRDSVRLSSRDVSAARNPRWRGSKQAVWHQRSKPCSE